MMLTLSQAAALLRLTPQRVGQLIKSGKLPAKKHGRDWMIEVADLARVQGRKPGRPRKNK